jgi:2-oxoglutarate dehydrogenase E2 component (dihydrolipoamide succinyltransferase)
MASAIEQLAQKARSGQLKTEDLQGGTFTITNHGVFGSLFATPIINQPQAGILGIGTIEKRVCVVDDMIAIRPKSFFSFSFDHRLLDGADADRFMQVIKETLEAWQ